MEKIINLHIEKLPEGVYLATSNDMPGLIVQGETIAEVIEFAKDVAEKLIEIDNEWAHENAAEAAVKSAALVPIKTPLDMQLVVAA